jgi:hypothetical protein
VKKQAYDFNVFLKAGVRRPWATGDATQQRLGARCWSWSWSLKTNLKIILPPKSKELLLSGVFLLLLSATEE